MGVTKKNHEFESIEGRRKLDPIGKMFFSKSTNAEKEDKIHTIDLKTSSNFYVDISTYLLTTNWINFINYENIHRFDVVINVQLSVGPLLGEIKFGDGVEEYKQPQMNIGTKEPKLFWIHGDPYPRLRRLRTNRSAIITFRYGFVFGENGVEEGFIGYLPHLFGDITTITTTTTTTDPEELTLFIPQGFTPDGDGINDYFVIYLVDGENNQYPLETLYPNTRMYIYVIEADTVIDSLIIEPYHNNFWDGKDSNGNLVAKGTYYYSFLYGKEDENPGDSGQINGFVVVMY